MKQRRRNECMTSFHNFFRKTKLWLRWFYPAWMYAMKFSTWWWFRMNCKMNVDTFPGLCPIMKNLSSDKFSYKNPKSLNPPIFSEDLRNFKTKYFGADFQKFSSEFLDRNEHNLKICGNFQNSENFFSVIEPRCSFHALIQV